MSKNPSTLADLTAGIVSAYVRRNPLAAGELPMVIAGVHRALAGLGRRPPAGLPPAGRPPAVPVAHSVRPDYIVCLEDGRKMKMLKRHLRRVYDLSPEDYRERWGLPPDYPMIAPRLAALRSRLARETGLGHVPRPDQSRAA